jgi:hypothetical protein
MGLGSSVGAGAQTRFPPPLPLATAVDTAATTPAVAAASRMPMPSGTGQQAGSPGTPPAALASLVGKANETGGEGES